MVASLLSTSQVDAPEDAEGYIHRVGRTARYNVSLLRLGNAFRKVEGQGWRAWFSCRVQLPVDYNTLTTVILVLIRFYKKFR